MRSKDGATSVLHAGRTGLNPRLHGLGLAPTQTKTPARTPGRKQFPCKQCGAKLEFAAGTDKLECPYCAFENDIQKADVAAADILYIEGYLWDAQPSKAASRKAIEIAKEAGFSQLTKFAGRKVQEFIAI